MSRKTPRAYRSELRRQQAEETRARILEAASEMFAADGYARTTLAKIAAAAGVSPETVQGQGSKAAILIAAIEHAAVGVAGEENVLNLEVGRRLLAIEDYARSIDFVVAAQAEVNQRTAPLARALYGGACSDTELDRYQTALIASVNSQLRRVLEIHRDRGWVRRDVPFDELVHTVAVLGSVETYLRVVHVGGWTMSAYRTWLRRMVEATVYAPPQPD